MPRTPVAARVSEVLHFLRKKSPDAPGDSFFDKLSLTVLPILTVYPLQFSFFTFWQRRRADIASALECQPSIVVLIDTFKPLAIANIAI